MEYRNQLLAALPPQEIERVAPHLRQEALPVGRVLVDVDRPIEAVWFPENGVISQVSVMTDGSGIETATIGREGFVGLPVFHGVDRVIEQAFVQVPASGYRLASDTFRELLPQCPTLIGLLHRFAQALLTLVAQSSGCNRKHSVDERCARWLLLVHDRVEGDEIELTQLFLSQMLGVRRATVTVAAGALQRAGAIRYRRGRITVLDRARLERASCDCYAVIRHTFDRLLGGSAEPGPLVHVLPSSDGMTTLLDGAPAGRPEMVRRAPDLTG
jgi:CRP-like cAMP-binding protein